MGNSNQKISHSTIDTILVKQSTEQRDFIITQSSQLFRHYSWLIVNQGKNNIPKLVHYSTKTNNDSCCYLGGTSTITGYFQPLRQQENVPQLNLTQLSQIQLLLDWLQGLWFLTKKYGYFHVEKGMLLFNQNKTGKIWINRNLLQLRVQLPITEKQQQAQTICIKDLLTTSKLFQKYLSQKNYKLFLHCICFLTHKKQQLLNLKEKVKNPTITLQTSNNSRKKNLQQFPQTVLNRHLSIEKIATNKRMFNTVNVIPNWKFINSSISSVGNPPIRSKIKMLKNIKQHTNRQIYHKFNKSMQQNYLNSSSESEEGILNNQEISIVQSIYIPQQGNRIKQSSRKFIVEQSFILENIQDFKAK